MEMDTFKWMALSVDYLLIVICPVVPFDMTEFCLLRYFLFFLSPPSTHTTMIETELRSHATGPTQRVW